MCTAENFGKHFEKTLSMSLSPKSFSSPIKHAKNNLGNDLDHFMGNADKRNQWEREKQRQKTFLTNGADFTETYTDENGNRVTEKNVSKVMSDRGVIGKAINSVYQQRARRQGGRTLLTNTFGGG